MDALEEARVDAVEEVAKAIIAAAGHVLATHGDDPCSPVILAAGFALATDKITEAVDPRFKTALRHLIA
jgi:hypothetical protein